MLFLVSENDSTEKIKYIKFQELKISDYILDSK